MKIPGFKIREFKEHNYRAIFNEKTGQTIRIALDPRKPIGSLEHPELLDVSFGTKCLANCSFCYTSAIKNGENYPRLVQKIESWFGWLDENQRPFQVAIGGGGEPTLHPEFPTAVKRFRELGIMPNYTTNGMHLNEEVMDATVKYCGGVAVSCHPHLDKVWKKAVQTLTDANVRTNLHIIVGEPGTADRFFNIYEEFQDKIEYFVLLPYQAAGRAKAVETEGEWRELFSRLLKMERKNIAFGALFYEFLLANQEEYGAFDISLYEPEIMSGYLMMDDDMYVRRSSYDLRPKQDASRRIFHNEQCIKIHPFT
jgi:MoaA/NifB/PqqE/SkfB family radical SAM enzyme